MAGLKTFDLAAARGAGIRNALGVQKFQQNALAGGLDAPKYGKQVQFAMNNGKLEGYAVGDNGTLKQLELPEGATWADTLSVKDMGDYLAVFGKYLGFQGGNPQEPIEDGSFPSTGLGGQPSVVGQTQPPLQQGGVLSKGIPPEKTVEHVEAIEKAKQGVKSDSIASDKSTEVTAKGQATRQQEWINSGVTASDAYPTVARSLDLLTQGIKTGGWDNVKLKASRFFGVTGADEAELSYNLGKTVLKQLRTTFGAAFTQEEGKRLEGIEASFDKSVEGNKRLLEQTQKILDRAMKRGLKAAQDSGDQTAIDAINTGYTFDLSPVESDLPKGVTEQSGETYEQKRKRLLGL